MSRKLTKAECIAWIAALRSSEYKQGNSALKSASLGGGFQYCCLGVLCEVAKVETHSLTYIYAYPKSQPRETIMLDYDTQTLLARMNDASRYTFDEIADFIESDILPKLED